MRPRPARSLAALTVLLTLPLLAACSGGSDSDASPSSATSTPAATATLTAKEADRAGVDAGTPVVAITPDPTPSASETTETTPTADPQVQAAAEELSSAVAKDSALGTPEDYPSYVTYTHPAGAFSVQIPAEWSDTFSSTPAEAVSNPPFMNASPNNSGLLNTTSTSGVFIRLSDKSLSPASLLTNQTNGYWASNCTAGDIKSYNDGRYEGKYQTFTDCTGGGTGSVLAVRSTDAAVPYAIVFDMTLTGPRDPAALARAMSTFTYTG